MCRMLVRRSGRSGSVLGIQLLSGLALGKMPRILRCRLPTTSCEEARLLGSEQQILRVPYLSMTLALRLGGNELTAGPMDKDSQKWRGRPVDAEASKKTP